MADDRLKYYTQAMEIDPSTNKPMPKVATQLTGVTGAKANIDDAGSLQVKIAGAEDSGGGALNVGLKDAQIIQPTDLQARYQTTIQTHAGVMVAPGTWNFGAWQETTNFDKVAVTMTIDANVSSQITIQWSNDNANIHGSENVANSATGKERQAETSTKAKYMRVVLQNGDNTAPHTMNSWIYLKV